MKFPNLIPRHLVTVSVEDTISDIFDSFIEAIEEFFTNVLAGASSSAIDSALNLFKNGLNSDSIVGDALTTTPNAYEGGDIFLIIDNICDNIVAPIGGMILVIILLYELISVVIGGNNFREFDTSIFFKWIFKCLCGVILISHTSDIIIGVFSMGSGITKDALELAVTGDVITEEIATIAGDIQTMLTTQCEGEWGILVTFLLFSLIMWIAVVASLVIVMLVIISRMIEAFMYISIAPIPMSTFMNKEWGTIGNNWLRNLLAIAFQGVFIVVAIALFQTMFTVTLQGMLEVDLTDGASIDLYFNMILCIVWAIALCFTVFRSSSVSKSVFNAH